MWGEHSIVHKNLRKICTLSKVIKCDRISQRENFFPRAFLSNTTYGITELSEGENEIESVNKKWYSNSFPFFEYLYQSNWLSVKKVNPVKSEISVHNRYSRYFKKDPWGNHNSWNTIFGSVILVFQTKSVFSHR